jgi:hypothetical protein
MQFRCRSEVEFDYELAIQAAKHGRIENMKHRVQLVYFVISGCIGGAG